MSSNISIIKDALSQSTLYKTSGKISDTITILSERAMSKQIPIAEFVQQIKEPEEKDVELSEDDFNEYIRQKKTLRLMDGISVLDGEEIHLLCDDKRSLMQQLCKTRLVVMRSYQFSCN